MIILPNKFKNFNAFFDGGSYAGRLTELTTPNLTLITEEYRGAGMDSPIDIDMGMEKLVFSFNVAELTPELIGLFSARENKSFQLRGYAEGPEGGSSILIKSRGMITSVTPDEWVAGGDVKTAYQGTLSEYELIINGRTEADINIAAGKREIGGVDILAEQSAALGI